MSKSTKTEREVIKQQEDKGVKDQISNLLHQPQTKYSQQVKFSDSLKSKPPTQDAPLSSDPRSQLNLQQKGGSQKLASTPPKIDLSAENFSRERENLFTKTSPATEKNILYVPKSNVEKTDLKARLPEGFGKETWSSGSQEKSSDLSRDLKNEGDLSWRKSDELLGKDSWSQVSQEKSSDFSRDLKTQEKSSDLRKDLKREGDLRLRKEEDLGSKKEEMSNVVPPRTSVKEGEMASSTFTQVPTLDINEEKIREYLMGALAYLKEAEEKMVEKFAEARTKIMEMHPQEKLSHAVDVTKDKALNALGVVIEDTAIAKEGIKHTYEKVRDSVVNIAEKVTESARSNYDVLKVKINDLSHKTMEEYQVAKEKLGEYSHKAQEMYENTKHKVQDSEITHLATGIYETTKQKVEESDLAHKAQEIFESTKNMVKESDLAHKAQEIYDSTKHKIGDISDEVVDFLIEPTGVDDMDEIAIKVRNNVEGEREAQLRRERVEREKVEDQEAERERLRILNAEDENTRIKLMSEEAPK